MATKTLLLTVSGGVYRTTDYALVTLTPAICTKIAARLARFRQNDAEDPQTYEVYYFDGDGVAFLANEEGRDEDYEPVDAVVGPEVAEDALSVYLSELGDFEGLVELPNPERLDGYPRAWVECVQMIVGAAGVRWMCYLKHTDVEVRTADVPWTVIEEVLRGAG